ncbi:hypothetical protein EDD11_008223 [Mortierella claussenii]|nr:hypothetical protein EDD11_008223 [Mortierella claussenii]
MEHALGRYKGDYTYRNRQQQHSEDSLRDPQLGYVSPHLTMPHGNMFEGESSKTYQNLTSTKLLEPRQEEDSSVLGHSVRTTAQENTAARCHNKSSAHGDQLLYARSHLNNTSITSMDKRPSQVEIDISMNLSSGKQQYDSRMYAIFYYYYCCFSPYHGSYNHSEETNNNDPKSDIERYTGLMKKAAHQMTSNSHRHHRYSSHNDDLEPEHSIRNAFSNKPTHAVGSASTHQSDILPSNEKTKAFLQDSDNKAASPAQTVFSFSSIKSNLLSRLFGPQDHSGNSYGSASTSRNPNPAGESNYSGESSNPRETHELSSHSYTADPTCSRHADHEEQAEDLTRKITSGRIMPSRSGGILSNLLKLQALSMPPPTSHHHRKQRNRQHRSRRPRRVSHGSSVGSEADRSRHTRHMLSSPSATMISLPGLLMTAPSGVGMTPHTNADPPSPSGLSSNVTTQLNTPTMTEHGLRVSTSSIGTAGPSLVHRAAEEGGDYSGHQVSMMPKESTLSPGKQVARSSHQYLKTHRSLYSTRSSISGDDATSVYSGLLQDPLVAAIRLNQEVELTEAVADILQRQDLLIRLCKSFIRYGAPSHRIELAMEAMCRYLGIDGSFAFLPGLMMISFGDSDTHTSETHLIKCAQGFDMGRLAKVHKIARALVNGNMEPTEALVELKSVNSEKAPYNIWVMLLSFAVSSGLIAPLVFHGSWADMLASMALGTVVGLTTLLASRYSVYSSVFEVSTSILIAFVTKALRDYVCFTGVVLSAIVMLLPGLSLTTAIMELSSRYMISGSVRMFYSLIYCLFLGFGVSIGSNLWDVFREPAPGDMKMGYCHPATEPWRWIFFPLMGISLSIQLYASPRQWPVMIVCSSVGYAVSELGGLYWPHSLHIAAAVSAFIVGLLGNIYERVTHELAFVPILGAILLIVPGGMGVRSTLMLLDQSGNASQGTAFALQMILVALGIAVGLFASTLVVYPLGKRRNALLTF